eukprot:COSAG04_NODE_12595_length_645_cov_0.655678_1_plen_154_part_10
MRPGEVPKPTPPPPPQPIKPAPAGAKNVLFIISDDLRPEMLEAYGQKQMITPHFDALAKESIVFNRAYCQRKRGCSAFCAFFRIYITCAAYRGDLRPDAQQLSLGAPAAAHAGVELHRPLPRAGGRPARRRARPQGGRPPVSFAPRVLQDERLH